MAVPLEIRNVARPVNTVVVNNNHKGKRQYAVLCRDGYIKSASGKIVPKNGKVVGYIYDGKFCPRLDTNKEMHPVPFKQSYGSSMLVFKLGQDVLEDLTDVFGDDNAERIFILAAIRAIRANTPCSRFKDKYESSFLSVLFPHVHVSKNTVSDFLELLGMNHTHIVSLYHKRIARLANSHRMVIDGTLVTNNSYCNDLSQFSYKSKIKGSKDISILYCYDLDRKEPICTEVYSGNTLDSKAMVNFLQQNDIQKGIIIVDKGFSLKDMEPILATRKELSYLVPIKRNSVIIKENNMLSFTHAFKYNGESIRCAKKELSPNCFLYSFQNLKKASIEIEGRIRVQLQGNDLVEVDNAALKTDTNGTIFFKSNIDMDCKECYLAYMDRWELESIFKRLKDGLVIDTPHVHNNYSVTALEFILFISSIIHCKIYKIMEETNLKSKYSVSELIDELNCCWRESKSKDKPDINDGHWGCLSKQAKEILVKLDLATDINEEISREHKKPGAKTKSTILQPAQYSNVAPVRSRGRPRKEVDPNELSKPKRPRGRPRKEIDPNR